MIGKGRVAGSLVQRLSMIAGVCTTILLFPLSDPSPAGNPPAPPAVTQPKGLSGQGIMARASDVVNILETFFPSGKGRVTGITREGRISIDRGRHDGLYPGSMVMIYRPGPPFRDFYTGILIGHREDTVGWVELRSVEEDSATGLFRGSEPARIGDRIRMPESLIRIALVPTSRYADLGVISHLTRALQKSRRFSVVDPFSVDLAIRKMGKADLSNPVFRSRLARTLRAQSLVLIDTTLLGDHVLLNLEIAGGLTGKKAFTLETGLTGVQPLSGGGNLLAGIDPNMHIAKLPPLSVPFRSVKLPFIPFFLTEGQYIPGQGAITALSDGRRIVVGTIGKSRVRTHYQENDPHVMANRHVFISSGPVIPPDKEHPGMDQIAVTNIVGGALDSYVLDFDGTTFRRIAKHLPWYIRIVRMADGKDHLIGQKMGVNKAFLGHIHVLRWNLDHFEKGDPVKWAKAITLFGTVPIKTGGQDSFLKIAADNHLEYYDIRGDLRFKSPIFLGGYSNHFVFGQPHALLPVQSRSVKVKGRILVLSPPNNPGRPIAIVYKNIPMSSGFGNFQGYQYGQVYFYRWTGVNWALLGELTRVKNFIRDITILQDRNTGKPALAVGTEPVFNFMNIQNLTVKEGSLLYFSLPPSVDRALKEGISSPTLMNRPAGVGGSK